MDELDSALSLCAAIQQDKDPEAYQLNRSTIMSMVNADVPPDRAGVFAELAERESGWRKRCAIWPRAARKIFPFLRFQGSRCSVGSARRGCLSSLSAAQWAGRASFSLRPGTPTFIENVKMKIGGVE
jgi:hypothetical protein